MLLPLAALAASALVVPPTSAGVPNKLWAWRGQQIRYHELGEDLPAGAPCVVLVHGLFVNADHWRRNLPALAAAGFRAYSIDLLGYGHSSKPPPCGDEARALSGERGRPLGAPPAELGTAAGGARRCAVELAHPLGSCYNFYTWAEQLADFAAEVLPAGRATLVANSIGSIAALQAAIDVPAAFDGVSPLTPST